MSKSFIEKFRELEQTEKEIQSDREARDRESKKPKLEEPKSEAMNPGDFLVDMVISLKKAIELIRHQLADLEFKENPKTKKQILVVKRKSNNQIILQTEKDSEIVLFFEYLEGKRSVH